jgi:4-hydroxy-L-threonine phosphate dehydrogenase PdxA
VASARIPTVALTLGDPAGIGPEVVAKLLSQSAGRIAPRAHVVVVGDRWLWEDGQRVADVHPAVDEVASLADARTGEPGAPRFLAVDTVTPQAVQRGAAGAAGGASVLRILRVCLDAVRAARAEDLSLDGPFPADTIFRRAAGGRYDGVLTMYHDQGQIAMKLMGFERGVTVQGGLPIPITTPAHGTAYDIAGQNKANPEGMTRAVLLACRMAASHGA